MVTRFVRSPSEPQKKEEPKKPVKPKGKQYSGRPKGAKNKSVMAYTANLNTTLHPIVKACLFDEARTRDITVSELITEMCQEKYKIPDEDLIRTRPRHNQEPKN